VTIPKKITYYRSSPLSLAIDNYVECSKDRWLTIIPVTPNSNKHHEHRDKFSSLCQTSHHTNINHAEINPMIAHPHFCLFLFST
jgi:hypothetical protein